MVMIVAGGAGLVTPALLDTPRLMYGILTALVAIGLLAGWRAFREPRPTMFGIEDKDLAEALREPRATRD